MSTKKKLDLIRLLSAIESAVMVSKTDLPDYLWEQISATCDYLEAELLKPAAPSSVTNSKAEARAVFGIPSWPESLGEEFFVFRVLPAETDAEAITRAESAYSPGIEFIVKDYPHE